MATLLTLPTELLNQIFSSVSSSKSDLFHLLQASKQFTDIVKPLLYHHIIITDKVQRDYAKLVRNLDIQGCQLYDPYREDSQDDDDNWSDPRERWDDGKVATGCVRDLFEGKLLDFSVIESLHVINVQDLDTEQPDDPRPLTSKIASNLVELSVYSHSGAGELWEQVRRPDIVPNLRRLGFTQVTRWEMDSDGYDSDLDLYPEAHPRDRKIEIPSTLPTSRLEVLVSEPLPTFVFPRFPLSKILATVSRRGADEFAQTLRVHQNVRISWAPHPLNEVEFRPPSTGALRFLSLPALHNETLSEEGQKWIDKFESEGGQVQWDKDDDWKSTSIIPQHFLDYLNRQKAIKSSRRKE